MGTFFSFGSRGRSGSSKGNSRKMNLHVILNLSRGQRNRQHQRGCTPHDYESRQDKDKRSAENRTDIIVFIVKILLFCSFLS